MNDDPVYKRENAFATCESCNGPIFHGEPGIWYDGADGKLKCVHRFTTYCDFYKNQEKQFTKSLGIAFDEMLAKDYINVHSDEAENEIDSYIRAQTNDDGSLLNPNL